VRHVALGVLSLLFKGMEITEFSAGLDDLERRITAVEPQREP
jgi:hypothetical protein